MADQNLPRSIRLTDQELRDVVKSTVLETFVTLGVDVTKPIEVQKDFAHLRRWRIGMDVGKSKGFTTVIVIAVTAAVGWVWLNLTGGKV
jgi:hypothetical protein